MEDSFIKKSRITGKPYDYFKCIKIFNFSQAEYYIENNVILRDICFVPGDQPDKKKVVFYFYREDTKDAYDKWCKHKK